MSYKTNACLRLENPGQLAFAVVSEIEENFGSASTGNTGALCSTLVEASQLHECVLPDDCALTPERKDITVVATKSKIECIPYIAVRSFRPGRKEV